MEFEPYALHELRNLKHVQVSEHNFPLNCSEKGQENNTLANFGFWVNVTVV